MPKRKYYTVWKGFEPGVYKTWKECEAQVKGFAGARYKSFGSREEAEKAYHSDPPLAAGNSTGQLKKSSPDNFVGNPVPDSICVDAACSGNPGVMEYRGVFTATGEEIFHQGPFRQATNNIGEFLAIVHALAWMKKNNICLPVYSDSRNAILWVKHKQVKTKLERNQKNEKVFELIERALNWLNENTIESPILKWETEVWGEIPADFGRK